MDPERAFLLYKRPSWTTRGRKCPRARRGNRWRGDAIAVQLARKETADQGAENHEVGGESFGGGEDAFLGLAGKERVLALDCGDRVDRHRSPRRSGRDRLMTDQSGFSPRTGSAGARIINSCKSKAAPLKALGAIAVFVTQPYIFSGDRRRGQGKWGTLPDRTGSFGTGGPTGAGCLEAGFARRHSQNEIADTGMTLSASVLLCDPAMKISVIAEGCDSPSSFYSDIRSVFAMTPSEFREQVIVKI